MGGATFRHDGLSFSVHHVGAGSPFVFQHGLCGAASQPAEVFPQDIGWQCLTLACRGHGASEPGDPEQFSIATFADDVSQFIAHEAAGPVVLGGISMGAAIALRIAVKRPELVRGLVLARPAWIDQTAPDNLSGNREVGNLLHDHDPDVARSQFGQSQTARQLARDAPDNLASLLGFFDREPITITAALLRRIASDGPAITRQQIAALRVPTLVVGHDRDAIHPLAMARDLAALIPGSRLAEITPKASSLGQYRADFRAALRRFLLEFQP
jgi:pimeloyl-ACP methyl ester carboxylesterase